MNGPGRPVVASEVRALIRRMTSDASKAASGGDIRGQSVFLQRHAR